MNYGSTSSSSSKTRVFDYREQRAIDLAAHQAAEQIIKAARERRKLEQLKMTNDA